MFNAERLTLARQRRGLKKTDLARMIGKVPRTITLYEKEASEPTDKTIDAIAQALDFPVEFFHQPLGNTVPMNGASFRALSRMTATQRDAALAVGTLGVALNEWIEERFELPEAGIPSDLQPGLIDPEGAAALLRTRWGLGEAPIPNMLHLLEAHGVRVFSLAEECKEVDAYSFWIGDTPYICLATYKTAERAIFDAAHELGHLLMHRDHAAPRGRAEEREADEFASCFLMPKSDVLAETPRNPSLDDLVEHKHRWRVSTAALNYRLHQLGRTSDWHYRELCIQLSRIGRNLELNPLPHETSQLLEKVFSVVRGEGTTRGEVASALHIYEADLDALTFGLTLKALEGGRQASGEPSTPPRLYVVR